MLVVKCEEYLAKVREFAKSVGLLDQLERQLEYLGTYACHEENGSDYTRCELYSDFAPHSFSFCMFVKDKTKREGKQYDKDGYTFWFSGGCIYNGPSCPGDGSFPTLSVSIEKRHGWGIHT